MFTVQSQCKPNAMMLASIAEVQPEFAKFLAKVRKKCHTDVTDNTEILFEHGYNGYTRI